MRWASWAVEQADGWLVNMLHVRDVDNLTAPFKQSMEAKQIDAIILAINDQLIGSVYGQV